MVVLGSKGVQSEDDIQGNARPLPGRYHVVVKDVDETMEKYDKVIVTFEALKGTTPGQEGREIPEYFATTEKALPRLQRLALVLGLLKADQDEREVSFVDGIGRDCVIEVEEHKYTNKEGQEREGVRISFFGFWSTSNKEVDDVPKDGDFVRSEGDQKETAATAAVATDKDDPYADL